MIFPSVMSTADQTFLLHQKPLSGLGYVHILAPPAKVVMHMCSIKTWLLVVPACSTCICGGSRCLYSLLKRFKNSKVVNLYSTD